MPCYHPLRAFRSLQTNGTGTSNIVFKLSEGFKNYEPIMLPCGQCIGCRLERSRDWACRMMHEASQYENNCFITLTYDDKNLPHDLSLHMTHFQKFMKKLRFHNSDRRIKFFHCGEYGEATFENGYIARPHYHAILFNYDFPDKELWKNINGNPVFISESLSKRWKKGFSTIGTVTFESAAYVARYCLKKINGDLAEDHYTRSHPLTGEILQVDPEYATMSRRPAIGKDWYSQFKGDLYPSDFIISRGNKVPVPKYYDRLLAMEDPETLQAIKEQRIEDATKYKKDNTRRRLAVRETVKKAQLKLLPRD